MTNPTPDAPEFPAAEGYVYEQPAAPMAAPPKPKKTGLIVLSVLAVLLLGGAATFGVLYFKEKDHAKSLSLELDSTKKDLTASALRENAAKADLSKEQDLRNKAEEAQKKAESASVSNKACHDAANNLRAAAISQDQKKVEAALESVFLNC
ncbi:hypothetical protein SAMN05421504_10312 [Amycolatopsis xylanica]|uniref:Uncharacterized protein n=1 Tax=Amycolatopsis xylanica TaxID=589385 RepID=A0A1H3CEY6_9PSEU|nr:hypothetical protein [Amycolatopsis xylanica]SDX52676.1 hypothetical protein SAMN05421504_10312 [Amycolatopsis xylanica]